MAKRKVVFLCKGTRGDVQPLLTIALDYKQHHAEDNVIFACVPSSLYGIEGLIVENGIQLFHFPDLGISLHQDMETAHKLASDEARLLALKEEATACMQVAIGANLIVFNLFSLEGYFIAQHLRVPCIAASPHILTRTPPAGFESKLAKAHPDLYHRLKSSTPGCVSYAEVEHWMWRLFLDDFGQVCETLGIPSVPFTPLPGGEGLPPPTLLLYGVSSNVLPRQPYWPQSVALCGYWLPPPALQLPPDPRLTALIQSVSSPLLYVGFGSMEMYMLDVNWTMFFQVLEEALESLAMEALFQCMDGGAISQAYSQWKPATLRVHLWTGPLPHSWLFEKCSAVLHHGGSGTVATALLAKRPQIICPVMFDQQFWAEHLSWEGLAYQCPEIKRITVRELEHGVKVALGSAIKKHAADIGAVLDKEDGVRTALVEIDKLLDLYQAPQKQTYN